MSEVEGTQETATVILTDSQAIGDSQSANDYAVQCLGGSLGQEKPSKTLSREELDAMIRGDNDCDGSDIESGDDVSYRTPPRAKLPRVSNAAFSSTSTLTKCVCVINIISRVVITRKFCLPCCLD